MTLNKKKMMEKYFLIFFNCKLRCKYKDLFVDSIKKETDGEKCYLLLLLA